MAATHESLLTRMDPSDCVEEMLSDAEEEEEDAEEEVEKFGSVKPLLVTNIDALGCQNDCGGPLKVPIKQCFAGHLFCSDCHRGHVDCMLCEDNKLFPAPSVDAILNTILDVCPFEFCKKQIPFYQLEDHVEGCGFSIKCPIPQCGEMRASRFELESHLTQIHGKQVYPFHFGVPFRFAFAMRDDTGVFIESSTKLIFVVHYEVGASSTRFKFYCINTVSGLQFTYTVMDHNAKTALLAESTVPVIVLGERIGAIRFGGALSNQYRTGDDCNLYCSFLIAPKHVPEN